MHRLRHLAVLAAFSGGCIIYEEDLSDGVGGGDGSDPARPGDDAPGDTGGAVPDAPDVVVWLDPAGVVVGDSAILSLYTDGSADLSLVDSVRFFGDGDVSVLATDSRGSGEFLVTVTAPVGGSVGGNDLLVAFSDGTAVFVEAALQTVSNVSEIPAPDFEAPSECP